MLEVYSCCVTYNIVDSGGQLVSLVVGKKMCLSTISADKKEKRNMKQLTCNYAMYFK